MTQLRFWVFAIIALLFLGMAILSFGRALRGGGNIQYFIAIFMTFGFLLFFFIAQAIKAGKWPWE